MADKLVPILCTRWRPHQAPLKGVVTGRIYIFERKGLVALCMVDERDLKVILTNRFYKRASEREYRLWLG